MSDWLRGILGSILVGGAAAALVTATIEAFGEFHVVVCRCHSDAPASASTLPR